jgi:hypothetical protein
MTDLYVNKDGTEVNLRDVADLQGLRFLGLTTSAPNLNNNYISNAGVDGNAIVGTSTFSMRTVTANFFFQGTDLYDFELACRSIWRFFYQREPYYIRSTAMPGIRYRVSPKPYDPSRINVITMTFSIEFDLISGFAESYGTTLDMFTYDSELWQVGMNLPSEDLQYVFSGVNQFSVYNASDIKIDPFQRHQLEIALTCVGTPTIQNLTTGDVFSMTTAMSSSDTLLIDGVDPYLNNVRCGRQTNHGVITLEKGWNQFSITGCYNPVIAFNFRFLYF